LLILVALECFDSYKIDYSQESADTFGWRNATCAVEGNADSRATEENYGTNSKVVSMPRFDSCILATIWPPEPLT